MYELSHIHTTQPCPGPDKCTFYQKQKQAPPKESSKVEEPSK